MNELEQIKKQFLKILSTSTGRHVFIRIPKTGTQSMNVALSSPWDHYSAKFCKELLGPNLWDRVFSFSMVRNPWSRMYSFFKYHKIHSDQEGHKLFRPHTFESWIKDGMPHHYTLDHEISRFPKNPHIQFEWISDNEDVIVDYYFKLESIDQGIKKIEKELGIDIKIPHINRSTSIGEYREKYSPEMKNIVGDYCNKDIEYFKYEF
jgi:hypothetical protein